MNYEVRPSSRPTGPGRTREAKSAAPGILAYPSSSSSARWALGCLSGKLAWPTVGSKSFLNAAAVVTRSTAVYRIEGHFLSRWIGHRA